MKKLFTLLTLSLMSANVFGSVVPPEKLSAYKDAVSYSLDQHPLSCTFSPAGSYFYAGSLAGAIQTTQTATLMDNGTQPLLTFSSSDQSTLIFFNVNTSADFKTVTSVYFAQQACTVQQVNVGTIENPNIISQNSCTTTISASCK